MEESNTNEKMISVGDAVVLKDLPAATLLNGRLGVVQKFLPGGQLAVVKLFLEGEEEEKGTDKDRKSVPLKPAHLRKLPGFVPPTADNGPCEVVDCCRNCGEYFKECQMLDCSRCLLVRYCSRNCQRIDWETRHNHQCEAFRQARKKRRAPSNLSAFEACDLLEKLASRFRDKQKYAEAAELLRDGINDLWPYHCCKLYNSLALVLDKQGRMDEAVDAMKHVISIKRGDPNIPCDLSGLYRSLAIFQESQGDYKQAIKNYQIASDASATIADDAYNIGVLQFTLRRYNEAEVAFTRYLQELGDPQSEVDVGNAGSAYFQLAFCVGNRASEDFKSISMQGLGCPKDALIEQCREALALIEKAIHLVPTRTECNKVQSAYQQLMREIVEYTPESK